ncbi:26S protease regulatory subunit [Solihabitans fulvus]|uniref:26S protease regulatory subunit n=1 Tax=Solihabitans fulvus TaxID=1892852 RepID=A0A5B2XTD3_9PSEU|nr:ATP-binding protein [Solihabitans fulvus]KAA2266114.1 26S protease regulatory subunit [Solihabitans fulvus]
MTDIDPADARALARALRDLLERAGQVLSAERESPLVKLITDHLGCPLSQVPNVTIRFDGLEHVNLQRAVDAYVAEHSPDAAWFGIAGGHPFTSLIEMLTAAAQSGSLHLAAVNYVTTAIGPDTSTEVVQFGLVRTAAPDGSPAVLAISGAREERGDPRCSVQVLAASRETAAEVRAEVELLHRKHNVFLGQVLTFGANEHRAIQAVSFLPRPELAASDVILPDGVLDSIERHVVRSSALTERLRAHGQHLKRGLLLYGPPGTGKTHTIRYLLSRLTDSTVILLSGTAIMRMLQASSALARRLAPAVVVVEDVDLIAESRHISPSGNPVLFELLNEMDGLAADADVTFVLTTNRVEVVERALIDRPGRIDLAVEVPRPDADARERLLRLYARDAELDPTAVEEAVAATEGVAASFVKELVRRAVLTALETQQGEEVSRLDGAALSTALAGLLDERQALTRSVLGGGATR